MYQRSSQEPRYKQSTRAREPRHAESNEYSEVCSSEEEEEESTDRCSEETEEDSAVTLETISIQESEKTQVLDQRNSNVKYTSCDKFCINPNLSATKTSKKDQFTQKNLLSPFPSYWAPPIQKEVSGGTYCRVSNIMPITEEQCQYQANERSPVHSPRKKELEREKYAKRSDIESDKKWEKYKPVKDGRLPKADQPEETMRRENRDSSGKFITPLMENISKNFGGTSSRRPRTSSRDIECCNQLLKNCPDCVPIIEARTKSKRKSMGGADCCTEKDYRSKDVLSKDIGDGKLVKGKGKEVKEKLVYVVEEDGKDPTKIETDIFSLNEILAIKKDLLELSEFAKKLKKLKEMKKDSECGQNKNNPCQCHPAEELLRDVNKRIEALEARQEELERKNQSSKNSPKGVPKTPTKKLVKPKTLSLSPPKTPIVANLSAATPITSDPKTEMLVTRAEGFGCSSDIVNELMDIKTQLEKLEKKRMLKDFSKENIALKDPKKLNKTKDHAIAVFSSKTYILTTDNFDKTKGAGEKTKKEKTKDNVVNWLKNVSQDRPENEMRVFLTADAKREENFLDPKQKTEEHVCQNWVEIPKQEDFENQEPQKNRALENIEKGVDMSFTYFVKNQAIEETNQFGEQKKCIVTSSGKFIAVVSKSSINIHKDPPKEEKPQPPPEESLEKASPKIVHRSASNGSIPSTILIKRQLKKLKSQLTRKKHRNEMRVIGSKSATTIVTKPEKQSHSRKVKNSEKAETSALPTEKKHKEGKTEFFKRLEAQFMTLARSLGMLESSTTSCSYSELLATVDLETEPVTPNPKNWPENPTENQIIMYSETKKRSHERKHKPRPKKKQSCEEACKELKKRRKLEEKCRKIEEILDRKFHKENIPRKKHKVKPPKPKKPKVRHYHHHRCRSCLLVHPWHPPCKKKTVIQQPPLNEFQVPTTYSSEEKNYSSNSNTEYSSSQGTQKSLSYHEESSQPQLYPEPVHSPMVRDPVVRDPMVREPMVRDSVIPVERCLKPKRRSGLINTNLNLDQGLLKKFFKNFGRCYPRLSDKDISINEKCCVRRIRKCSHHGSRRSGSGERYFPSDGNLRSSQPPFQAPLQSSSHPPPYRPPPPLSPTSTPPPPPHPQSPQPINRRTSQVFRHNQSETQPSRQQVGLYPSNDPYNRNPVPHVHQHNPRHRHSRSPCTPCAHVHNHNSRSHSRHRHRVAAPQQVARCEYENVGPFLENRNQLTHSSAKDFEPLDDGNRSKTSLRHKKTKKSKKTEYSLQKFNPQVYVSHSLKIEDESSNLLFDPLGRKTLLCVCSKCGNVHRRQEKRFNQRMIDQKAVDRKLKRIDKFDPLLEQTIAARLEDEFRSEYDHNDDSNYGSRSSVYDSHDLASESNHSLSDKHQGLSYRSATSDVHSVASSSAPSDSHSVSYASAPSTTSVVTPRAVPQSKPAPSNPPPASSKPAPSNPPPDSSKTAPSNPPSAPSKPAPSSPPPAPSKPAPSNPPPDSSKPASSNPPPAPSKPASSNPPAAASKPASSNPPPAPSKPAPSSPPAASSKPAPSNPPPAPSKPAPSNPPPAPSKPAPSNPPPATSGPAPSTAPTTTSKPAPSTAPTTTSRPAPSTAPTTTSAPAPSTAPQTSSRPAPVTSINPAPYTAPYSAPNAGYYTSGQYDTHNMGYNYGQSNAYSVGYKYDKHDAHDVGYKYNKNDAYNPRDAGNNYNHYDAHSLESSHYDDHAYGQKCDQCSNYSYDETCDLCVEHRKSVLNKYCSDHYSDEECDLCENHPVSLDGGNKQDICCESPKPKEICKEPDSFPFLSFLSQLFKLKPRKPPPKPNAERIQTGDGCQCSNKFDVLETRLNEIERGLSARPYEGQPTMTSRAQPQPSPGPAPRPPPGPAPRPMPPPPPSRMRPPPPVTAVVPPPSGAPVYGPGPGYGPGPAYGPGPGYGPGPAYGPAPGYGPGPAYGPAPGYGPAGSGPLLVQCPTPGGSQTSVVEHPKSKRKQAKMKLKKVHPHKVKTKKPKSSMKQKTHEQHEKTERHHEAKHKEPKEKHHTAKHKTSDEEEESPKHKEPKEKHHEAKHREPKEKHHEAKHKERKEKQHEAKHKMSDEEESPPSKTLIKPKKGAKRKHKPSNRHSKRLDREEKKLHKRIMATAWAYKKWDELERRKRLQDINRLKKLKVSDFKRLKDREAGSYYFTVRAPTMPQTGLNLPQLEGSRLGFPLHRKLKDGFCYLQSLWTNFRNKKFNSEVENIVNKMKSNPHSDSEELIHDCRRRSKKPYTREAFEMKGEPHHSNRKHIHTKRSDGRIKRERRSSKIKSGRGGYR